MPNLRGASPVGRGRGRQFAHGTDGQQKIGEVSDALVMAESGARSRDGRAGGRRGCSVRASGQDVQMSGLDARWRRAVGTGRRATEGNGCTCKDGQALRLNSKGACERCGWKRVV